MQKTFLGAITILYVASVYTGVAFAEPWTFVVSGDSRTGRSDRRGVAQGVTTITGGNYAFWINTGDITGDATSSQYANWMADMAPSNLDYAWASWPPLRWFNADFGNHERGNVSRFLQHFPGHINKSAYPGISGSPDGLYGSFKYQNVLVVWLARYTTPSSQSQFMADTAAAAATDPEVVWKFVHWHAPPAGCGGHGSDGTSDNWADGHFQPAGFQMGFYGHNHNYFRTCAMTNTSSKTCESGQNHDALVDPTGMMHITAGVAGASISSCGSLPSWGQARVNQHGFALITVDGGLVTGQMYSTDGGGSPSNPRLEDEWTIRSSSVVTTTTTSTAMSTSTTSVVSTSTLEEPSTTTTTLSPKPRKCKKQCKRNRKACKRAARQQYKSERRACSPLPRAERRFCRKRARIGRGAAKLLCRQVFHQCKRCCKHSCSSTTTTTVAKPPVTTTTITGSSTTTTTHPPVAGCPAADVVLSGAHPNGFDGAYASGTVIDATAAEFTYDLDTFPVILTGGDDVYWCGGRMIGAVPPDESWSYYHGSPYPAGILMDGPSGVTISNAHFENLHDAVRWQSGEATDYVLRDSYFTNIRDDAIDNHWQSAGLIEGNLFDGVYVWISTRAAGRPRYPERLIAARDNLVWLRDMPGPHPSDGGGRSYGHGTTWKWDSDGVGPSLALHGNIIRLDSVSNTGNGVLPRIPIESCSDNVFVWTGVGAFNEDLGQDPITREPCFTVTTDLGVWDDAVAAWRAVH